MLFFQVAALKVNYVAWVNHVVQTIKLNVFAAARSQLGVTPEQAVFNRAQHPQDTILVITAYDIAVCGL
ncbi:hypothetical protein D3C81_2190320 [compost metagenome]